MTGRFLGDEPRGLLRLWYVGEVTIYFLILKVRGVFVQENTLRIENRVMIFRKETVELFWPSRKVVFIIFPSQVRNCSRSMSTNNIFRMEDTERYYKLVNCVLVVLQEDGMTPIDWTDEFVILQV
jgi:hypothetical protein